MSFPPVHVVHGTAAAILRPNIDTDVIIRVEHLTKRRDEVAAFAFEAIRLLPDGSEDPDFALHRPAFRGSPILITGPNFGCGSSREPAVWALAGLGVRCIIGTTFGDIFFANCAQNGVLVVSLNDEEVGALTERCALAEPVTVDLAAQTVTTDDGTSWTFSILAAAKRSLEEGLDDVELAVREDEAIALWQERDRAHRPWVWTSTTSEM